VAARTLPRELTCLVHHIELNQAGWRQSALSRLILILLWRRAEQANVRDLRGELHSACSLDVDLEELKDTLQALADEGSIIAVTPTLYKVSENTARKIAEESKQAENSEERLCGLLDEAFRNRELPVSGKAIWAKVQESLLLPMVQELGARTYEVLSGKQQVLPGFTKVGAILHDYPEQQRQPILDVLKTVIDPRQPDVKAHLLRLLNAYFFLEATRLEQTTLDKLALRANESRALHLFVDTNFVFSILGLHEESENEAARALIELTNAIRGKINVKLYVLPSTIQEAKHVLEAQIHGLGNLRLAPRVANVATKANLGEFVNAFVKEVRKADTTLSAKDFFQPYLADLLPVLKQHQIEVYNANIEVYRKRDDVKADIEVQVTHEKDTYGGRAKGHAQVEHDVVLWYVAKERRGVTESPADAQYWIVTQDYRFLGFDRVKHKKSGGTELCLHPTALMQLLRFWIPRSQQFEDALVASLRVPLLFREFDSDTERVTVKILGVLARYQNLDDLSQDTIGKVLLSTAIRQQMKGSSSHEEEIAIVESVLIGENARLTADLEKAQQSSREALTEKDKSVRQIESLADAIVREKGERQKQTEQIAENENQRRRLESKVLELEAAKEGERKAAEKAVRLAFVANWLVSPTLLIAGIAALAAWIIGPVRGKPIWLLATAGFCVLGALWMWIVRYVGKRAGSIADWPFFLKYCGMVKFINAGAVAVTGAVFLDAISEWIRKTFGWTT
jgi:hypothetical protein